MTITNPMSELNEKSRSYPSGTLVSGTSPAGMYDAPAYIESPLLSWQDIPGWNANLLRAKSNGRWAKTNVYWNKADEIGISHGLPGVGHLGIILAPEGWKANNPPLTEAQANKLYEETRHNAQIKLDRAVALVDQVPEHAQTVQCNSLELLQERYQKTRQIDDMIRRIRVQLARGFESYLVEGLPYSPYDSYPPQAVNGRRIAVQQGSRTLPQLRINMKMDQTTTANETFQEYAPGGKYCA